LVNSCERNYWLAVRVAGMNKTEWVSKRISELMAGRYRWTGVDNLRNWLESLDAAEAEIVEVHIKNMNFGELKQQVFIYAWTAAYDVAIYEYDHLEELKNYEQDK
jgi:hypothetical protein